MVFRKDIFYGPTTVFRLIQDYCVLKGFNYQVAHGTSRLTRDITHFFFVVKKDREYALFCLNNLSRTSTGGNKASNACK